jgi:formylglycine-generating enzyme required for sulfatase activity
MAHRFAHVVLPAALLSFGQAPAGGADRVPLPAPSRPDPIVTLHATGSSRVLIPAGTFTMGSGSDEIEVAIRLCKKEAHDDESCEKPFVNELEPHQVTLSAYYIDRTEVTVSAYRRCVEVGRCAAPPYASGGRRFDQPDYPVTLVSWNDANDYCRFVGGRLPTEAEWERAARGSPGRRFPWGNLYNKSLANHGRSSIGARPVGETDDSDGFDELAPVGSFPAGRTPDGIDDMAGNAEEWVADAIDDFVGPHYPASSEVNPKGASAGAFRVVRGGSCRIGAAWLRGAARWFWLASDRRTFRGFRCVHPAGDGL